MLTFSRLPSHHAGNQVDTHLSVSVLAVIAFVLLMT